MEGGKGGTTSVGSYPEGGSPYGLLDMAGNVWEWTRSLWGMGSGEPYFRYPYNLEDGREDLKTSDNVFRVVRGGAFDLSRRDVRCACRNGMDPRISLHNFGFRVCVVSQQD